VPVARTHLTAAAFLLFAAASGCSDSSHDGSDSGTGTDTEIALSVDRVFPTEWQVDGGALPLTPFNSVATDGAGQIYVARPMSSDILVLDPEGGFVRVIGRRGDGEYGIADRVLALRAETREAVGYLDPPVVTANAFGTLGRQVVSVAVPNREATGDSVHLILRGHEGDTLRVIRYLRNPIPIDDEFRRHHLERITGVGVRGQYFATESRSRSFHRPASIGTATTGSWLPTRA
jgi:hypothetical protein